MKLDKKTKRNGLTIIGIAALLLVIAMLMNIQLSLIESSCSGENIWVKYTLANENGILSTNPDCASDPAAGWVGKVDFYAKSPTGTTTHLGGYTASPNSTQKINCGVSTQDGKTFAGGYIHNDGRGEYQITVDATYYKKSENYAIPHPLKWTDPASLNCVLPSTTCPDGTALRTCSTVQKGKYCGADSFLYDKAGTCGCPEGQQASGNYCVDIPSDTPEEDYPESPPNNGQTEPPTTPPTTTGNDVFYFGIASSMWIIILAILIILIAVIIGMGLI